MPDSALDELAIFTELLEKTGAQRSEYLAAACGSDHALRSRIERYLRAHQEKHGPLDEPLVHVAAPTIDPPAERPGTQIGPYKLLQQIGEGGFGVVYMAEQLEPVRRRVAVKVIKPGMDTRQVIARFEAERQALAVMDHPNIAKVLDAGTTSGVGGQESGVGMEPLASPTPDSRLLTPGSGRPYFVMELVRGTPITQYCDENSLNIRERLTLFALVCQAIQHAHTKGIIHRDIKPTNVLVTRLDGQPVVKVIDFGIAKAMGQQLTDKTLFTDFAQMIGTPLYMSPEQAELSAADIDTRSDIYSLGVLLYELLTGSTPVSKEQLKQANFDEIRRIIRENEAQRPSVRIGSSDTLPAIAAQRHVEPARLSGQVRGELDWIVMKCLEKDRNRRYETAASLAADVQRYLHDEPVQACPPSAWYRFGKFAKRNRREVLIAGAGAAVAMMGVAGLAVSRALIAREQRATVDALAAKTNALQAETRAKDDLRSEVYFQRITVAHRELSTGNLAAALRALHECPEDLRGWEWHYLMRLCKVEPLILQDSTEVYGVAFSPDGELIASAGKDGKVKIWNSGTGKVIKEIPAHEIAARSVAFHPDGRYIASAGADRLVKVWDLETGQEVFQGPCDAIRLFGASYTVAFSSPDGRLLAAGSKREVRVWDWKKNRPEAPEHTFPGPHHHSISVAFTRDGHRLATGGKNGLTLWDAESGRPLGTLRADGHLVSALVFSPDGGRLASASLDHSVKLWDTTTGELLQTMPHTGNVLGVAFSADGRRLTSAGEDKIVRVWDATTGREVLGLRGHTDHCACVAFSPDGRRLASASFDRTIRVWDATPLRGDERQDVLTFTQHAAVRSVAVSPKGERIVAGGFDGLVKVWDAATSGESFDFPGHSGGVFAAAWHPDGQRIATAGSDAREHAVKVWDASDGRVHFEISVGRDSTPFLAVVFSPDGRYLVTGKREGDVQVWDAKTRQKVQVLDVRTGQNFDTFATHDREIRALVFSKGGEHLATASGDGKIKLWDATRLDEKQEPRLTLQARVPGESVNVAFSPDGKRLATGGEENKVKIWDVDQEKELLTLRGHNGEVYTLAFSPDPDGRWIASGGEDSAVKIWDSHTGGRPVRTFRGHTGIVTSLAFSPNGRLLVSGSRDKTVKVWDMTQLETVPDR